MTASISPGGSHLFQTAGNNSDFWRPLRAFDPVDSISITDPAEIDQLKAFLKSHQKHLCAGYLSYDLGLMLQGVKSQHEQKQPLAVFHAYSAWQEYEQSLDLPSQTGLALKFQPSVAEKQYRQNIQKIHDYIRAGDFYQINYTQQLSAITKANPRTLFADLVQRQPAAFACYFETEDLALHSLSPELFLHYADRKLITEPIKGTRPRGKSAIEDESLKQALLNSEKEQAELFMITDLLRNDLGKVCEIGSVKLEAKKQVHKLPKVWHTSSRISGKLRSSLTPLDALLSMLPGGSISGCPKKRAVEVIDSLENSARGVYTGSIGYFHPDGDFSFNIAIRTLVQQGQHLSLGTGGGITIDSNWEDEWDELLVKASTFEQ